jgi:hypothetical protein
MPDTLTPLKNGLLRTCDGHAKDVALCALASALATITIIITDVAPHRCLMGKSAIVPAFCARKIDGGPRVS